MPTEKSATCREWCRTSTAPCWHPAGSPRSRRRTSKKLKLVPGKPRLGPCVGNVRNFIAIGLNYSDHAAEAGMPIPKEPIIFNKAPTSICGPNDNTITPKESTKLDYEVELGIVIGKRARYLDRGQGDERGRGLFPVERRVRALLPDRPFGRAMEQGQGLRDLRADRTLVRHQGRDQGPAEPRHVARRQRREASEAATPAR